MVVAGVVAVGLVASVLAARYTGAADAMAGGLTDAGPVVRWSLPLVRVVHDVAASLTIGSLLLAATMIPGRTRAESAAPDEPRRAAAFRVATAAAFVWAVAGAVGVVFTFADAAGMPLSDPSFGSNLAGSVWSIETLRVGLLSTIAAFVVASVAAVSRARSVAVALTAALGARPARPRTRRPRRRLGRPRDRGQRPRRAPAERGRLGRRTAGARRPAGPARGVPRRRGPALLDRRPLVLRHARRLRRHVGDDATRGVVRPRHAVRRPHPHQGGRLLGPRCRRRRAPPGDPRPHRRRRRRAVPPTPLVPPALAARAAASSCVSPWSRRSSWGSPSVSRRRWRAASRPCPRRWPTRALRCR